MRVQSRCIWRLPCNSELQRSSAAGHVCLRFSTTRPHRNSQAVEMERLVSAKMRLQCRAARKPRAASCLAAAQRMATTDNRPQASTSKGAASSKRKSTPQCHTQRAASALNIKAARPKEDLELITPRGRYIGPIRQPPEETTYINMTSSDRSDLSLRSR